MMNPSEDSKKLDTLCKQYLDHATSAKQNFQDIVAHLHELGLHGLSGLLCHLYGDIPPSVPSNVTPATQEPMDTTSTNGISITPSKSSIKKVAIVPWWDATTRDLCDLWSRMSQDGKGKWGGIQLVPELKDADYFVVVCAPFSLGARGSQLDPKKVIIVQMEPNMKLNPKQWGKWADPCKDTFLHVLTHETHLNPLELHLSTTYQQLAQPLPEKTKVFSAIVSGKYKDPGHQKRIDFLKYLESKNVEIDIYGQENPFGFKNYKGPLRSHEKDQGLLPYKYTFNAENHSIKNYITEKLADGIVAECCTFYWGCPNVYDHIPMGSFVLLQLENFEYDYQKVQRCIAQDQYAKMLPRIRIAKKKILEELQILPALEKILKENIQ